MGTQTTPIITTGSQWDGSGWRTMIDKIKKFLGIGEDIDAQGLKELYDSWVVSRKPKDTSPDSFLSWVKTSFPTERFGRLFKINPDDEEGFRTSFNVSNDISNAMGSAKK